MRLLLLNQFYAPDISPTANANSTTRRSSRASSFNGRSLAISIDRMNELDPSEVGTASPRRMAV